MKIKEMIQLDFREEKNRYIIQKEMAKIKPLSMYSGKEKIPLEKIEKLITVLTRKYNIRMLRITSDEKCNKESLLWRAVIARDDDLKHIATIYGLSIYEVFSKAAVYMYSVRELVGARLE